MSSGRNPARKGGTDDPPLRFLPPCLRLFSSLTRWTPRARFAAELQILLDDRCRKQVIRSLLSQPPHAPEIGTTAFLASVGSAQRYLLSFCLCLSQVDTFVKGGTLTERRHLWSVALRQALPNKRASEMLAYLEGEPAAQCELAHMHKRQRTGEGPSTTECETCTICQDPMELGKGGEQCVLPCNHTFHKACIIPWLSTNQNQTCPTCRFSVHLEDLPNGDVTVVAGAVPQGVQCAPCNTMDEDPSCGSSAAGEQDCEDAWESLPEGWLDGCLESVFETTAPSCTDGQLPCADPAHGGYPALMQKEGPACEQPGEGLNWLV